MGHTIPRILALDMLPAIVPSYAELFIKSEELEESKVCRVSGNIFGFGLVIFSSLLFSSLFSFYNFSVIIHLNHHGDSRKFLKIKINKTREKQNSLNSSLKTLSKEPCFP